MFRSWSSDGDAVGKAVETLRDEMEAEEVGHWRWILGVY